MGQEGWQPVSVLGFLFEFYGGELDGIFQKRKESFQLIGQSLDRKHIQEKAVKGGIQRLVFYEPVKN